MKRFHVHVAVADLDGSRAFYSRLFGAEPAVVRHDYLKWMIDDPRINFAISTRAGGRAGIEHLGLQAENAGELAEIRSRFAAAGAAVADQPGANCCYALSDKHWAVDPQGLSWEAFHTTGEAPEYGEDRGPAQKLASACDPAGGCCPARAGAMAGRVVEVLFLCTGNSARSILAEALLNHWGAGKFHGRSAGSFPTGRVHPLALELLTRMKIPAPGARSKSWDEFAAVGGAEFDLVITVCDRAAGETCPAWSGRPVTAHWSIEDPAAVQGPEAMRMLAFREAFRALEHRIRILVNLPLASLDRLHLEQELRRIGRDRPPAEAAAGNC